MIPVILSGGSGTRLWPLSRATRPKQFFALLDNHSLLQNTLLRLDGLPGLQPPVVICNEAHRFLVAEQLRELSMPMPGIILEPVGRNTAPAIAVAALQAVAAGDDPLLLVLPSDHVITDISAFQRSITLALPAAEQGKLVTFGVVPTHAHTGYGYIRCADTPGNKHQVAAVEQFCEKPELARAEQYVSSGMYFWNSGMFLFKASSYLSELEQFSPGIVTAAKQSLHNAATDLDFIRLDEASFSACPADSIDYAVMEKSANAVMVPLAAGWSDIGSWDALWQVAAKDPQGNAYRGDALLQQCRDSYVHATERLVTVVGLDDVVVVETKDAVLVAAKQALQDVKHVVDKLQKAGRTETELHREVLRPWGKYNLVNTGSRYQVKHISVKPGAKMSVQRHHHRAEHWVVVSGTALVRNGDKEFILTENESTYIPVGVIHSLENPGKIPLELIEVQSGSYLGEDDIVRYSDAYRLTD